ncbi:hypothetical protein QP978_02350 [Corynebacterium sp. MSK035]|uniref:hypothetical protein n=1 Tax=Corynebacterium TaxID=1716 RepID=UPI0015E0D276|nr:MULTISPECIES: hypothetical protein [Corynebacterium]MDK7181150.1 hypothetical protein [Corynebacterium riegelii]MDK8809757.1 hypothetical protein [Corynebacterium sp. MSK035]
MSWCLVVPSRNGDGDSGGAVVGAVVLGGCGRAAVVGPVAFSLPGDGDDPGQEHRGGRE